MKLALSGCLLMLLAGCAAQEAGQAPAGVPTVLGQPLGGGGTVPARGQADFTVRTVARAPSGLDLEVRGIDCIASSGASAAEFRSPARVVLPDTGEGIRVSCAGGGRTGAVLVEARQAFRPGPLRASPSVGLSVGSGGRVGTGIGIGLSPLPVPAGVTYDDVRVALR